jgi:prepilin-type N-terminal cleavage/methylation domain-containing protein
MSARITKRGFTLVEVLISVMLLSLLVTSVATAVRAALGSCKDNASSDQLNQTTRNLLLRITREMRTCDAIDQLAGDSHLAIYPITNAANIQKIEYVWDSHAKTLSYARTIDNTLSSQVIFDNNSDVKVTAFVVAYDVIAGADGVAYARRARVTITFKSGQTTTTLACSAAPRLSLTY